MKEPRFIALTVKRSGSGTCTCRHAHNHICVLTPAPVRLGKVIHNLVEPFCYKIGKLHFNHRLHSINTQTKTGANHCSLTDGCVADTMLSEFFNKAFCNLENAAILSDVLSHQYQLRVFFHGLFQAVADGINKSFFSFTGACRHFYLLYKRCKDICKFFLCIRLGVRFRKSLFKTFFNFRFKCVTHGGDPGLINYFF